MAYAYEGSATTQLGKIIYERKKHIFNACALYRLARKAPEPETLKQSLCLVDATLELIGRFRHIEDFGLAKAVEGLRETLVAARGDIGSFPGFGGGGFGGAGASGPIAEDPRKPPWWLGPVAPASSQK